MADIARLFAKRNLVKEELKKLKRKICEDGVLQPSLARRMFYEQALQCHYKEYRRVCFELLSTLPPERHDELDKDASHFEDIHADAYVLVEKLFHSFPSTGNMHQNDRMPSSSCFTATTAPRWRTPPIRSRITTPTTEHPVPISAVNETPRTSFPNKIKVSTIFADPIQNKKPLHDEDSAKNTTPPTSQKDSRVGNEPTEFVNSKTEDSKTMTIPMPTGLGPVLMPFRPPPGFHPTPERNPMPTGMPPVSQCPIGASPVPQPLQTTTGSQPVSQPPSSTTGSLSVFHSLQSKSDTHSDMEAVPMRDRILSGAPDPVRGQIRSDAEASNRDDRISSGARPVPVCCRITSEASRCSRTSSGIDAVPVNSRSFTGNYASPDLHRCQPGEEVSHYARRCSFGDQADHDVRRFPSGGQDYLAVHWSQPVGNPATMAVGSRPMVKLTLIPMSTGTSSVGSSALRFTDACSVINYAPVSTSSPPVVKTISPSTGASPVGSSAPTAVGSRPMVKPTPMSAGNSPVGNSVQRSTGASPVVEPILMSTGNDSVGNYALRSTDTRSVFNYAKMPVSSSPMVMSILTSTGAHPMVDSVPMSVGPFPAAKPTLTHIEANPPSQKSTRTSSVVKPTVIPTEANPEAKPFDDSAGLRPVAKPSPKSTGLHPVIQSNPTLSSTVAVNLPAPTMKINETNRTKKRTPPIAGTRPARNRVQSRTHQVQTPKTTEIRPAASCALMPFGIRPITKTSTRKQWIVVALKFDQPLLDPPPVITTGAFEQLHSGMRPRKPPDEPPNQTRPSEAIVERVSQPRPPNSPIRDDQALQFTIVPHFLAGEYVRASAKE
ncbi:mucin-17-like [Aedes albopictus]|uniref:Uncharacterized protein n=1 Tax=Aedes albopictus TaxID=7160 RepID=A0ABM1YLA4_AEDAL